MQVPAKYDSFTIFVAAMGVVMFGVFIVAIFGANG